MNLNFPKKTGVALGAIAFLLGACGDINNSWEVKGGGYIKYKMGDEDSHTIELAREDVHVPNINRHYIQIQTRIEESKRGDQISIMVNEPQIGKALTPVGRANLNGRFQYVTWMREQFSPEAPLVPDSSTIKFDERSDSLWSADLDLYFKDCRSGSCSDSLPPLHLTGRLRYWVAEDDR